MQPISIKRSKSILTIPQWRLDLLQKPEKYGLGRLTSIPSTGSNCLKRFISTGLTYDVVTKIPSFIYDVEPSLDKREFSALRRIWSKQVKSSGLPPIIVETDKQVFMYNPVWNLSKVSCLQDKFLLKLIRHHSKIEFDRYINTALSIGLNTENSEIFKFLGYFIFAGIPDEELAKRWKFPIKVVQAVRLIFFDFSACPSDKTAALAYIRQLQQLKVIDEDDLLYYRRVLDLGELGIRAQTEFYNLVFEERKQVEEYLGKSIVANTLNLQFTTKTRKESVSYNNVIAGLSNYFVRQKDSVLLDARIEHIQTTTKRMNRETLLESTTISADDQKLIELVDQLRSDADVRPNYRSLADLD